MPSSPSLVENAASLEVVLDTNILVSGLLSPQGPPGIILRSLAAGDFDLCLDRRIFAEYLDVLTRKKFNFSDADLTDLIGIMATAGRWLFVPGIQVQLPDPSDRKFLEVALACKADCLVTGNLKHFPKEATQGMTVISPREFLSKI